VSHERVDPRSAFSTPFDAPLVPTFPFTFRDVWILTVVFQADVEACRRIVPPPLECDTGLAAVHVYQMNDTDWFGRYNESAVQVQVRLPGVFESAAYSPYLLLDHDGAIAAGREVYGQPKKYGEPRIEVRQDLVVGTVSRNGIDVITATTPYKVRRSSPPEMLAAFDFMTNVNLKIVPAADLGEGVRELTARRLEDVVTHEVWTGPGTLELRPNAQVPVHLLGVSEVLSAFYWHCDFTLGAARTIHRYDRGGQGGLAAATG
jgi:acetoacetate decarboxylase